MVGRQDPETVQEWFACFACARAVLQGAGCALGGYCRMVRRRALPPHSFARWPCALQRRHGISTGLVMYMCYMWWTGLSVECRLTGSAGRGAGTQGCTGCWQQVGPAGGPSKTAVQVAAAIPTHVRCNIFFSLEFTAGQRVPLLPGPSALFHGVRKAAHRVMAALHGWALVAMYGVLPKVRAGRRLHSKKERITVTG